MTNLVALILAWDYGQLNTNTTFWIMMRTNITQEPVVLTTVPGDRTSVSVKLQPGAYFFNVGASNLWGMSTFSNVLELPEPPTTNHCISIEKQ